MHNEVSVSEESEGRKFSDFQNSSCVLDPDRRHQRDAEVVQLVVDLLQLLQNSRTFQICNFKKYFLGQNNTALQIALQKTIMWKGYIVLFDKFKKYIKYQLNRFVSDLFCFVLWYDGLKWSAIRENLF